MRVERSSSLRTKYGALALLCSLLTVLTVMRSTDTCLAATFVLEGTVLNVGVSDSGGLIDDNFEVGIDYDRTGTGTWTQWDFLKPGSPFEFYSIGIAEPWEAAGYSSGNPFSATSVNTSAGGVLSALTTGAYGDLGIQQQMSFLQNSGIINFTVTLTNNGTTTMSDLAYARGLDPDQDSYDPTNGSSFTENLVQTGILVTGRGPITDWTIGIRDLTDSGVPSVDVYWDTNPYNLFSSPRSDGDGDNTINIAWHRDTLAPGEAWIIQFQYIVDETFVGVVNLNIATDVLPNGNVDQNYMTYLEGTGGSLPYTWSLVTGSLPAGLTLDPATGQISGVPTGFGTSIFTVRLTDGESDTVDKELSISMVETLAITTKALPSGPVGSNYSTMLAAAFGVEPYSWAITTKQPSTALQAVTAYDPAILDDLAINPDTGELTWTPLPRIVEGEAFFIDITIMVTDDDGATNAVTFRYTDPDEEVGAVSTAQGSGGGCFITASGVGGGATEKEIPALGLLLLALVAVGILPCKREKTTDSVM